jgi:hypothetical protein
MTDARPDATATTPPQLRAQLAARARDGQDLRAIEERDLARYYRLLADELARLALTKQEAWLIENALAALRRARRDGRPRVSLADAAAAEWKRIGACTDMIGCDGPGLVERLRALSPAQATALVDAVERLRLLRRANGPAYRRGGEGWLVRAAGLVGDG